MLEKIDKFAPYLAVALLGYLTYTVTEFSTVKLAQGKDLPMITKQMLRPTILDAQNHSSPAGRDPFDVEWASYRKKGEGSSAGSSAAGARPGTPGAATSQPTTQKAETASFSLAETEPAAPLTPPPLPQHLTGVFTGSNIRTALIDNKPYTVGSLLGGKTPQTAWVVEAIEQDIAVLRFGDVRFTLRLTKETPSKPAEQTKREERK